MASWPRLRRCGRHWPPASTATGLQRTMPPGAARNALDCAFWDLEAKRQQRPVHEFAGLRAPHPVTTAFTISLAAPGDMAKAAATAASRALLKVKLGAAR